MEIYPMGTAAELAITDEIRVGNFVAQRVTDELEWGVGNIRPRPEHAGTNQEQQLVEAILTSIEPVTDKEMKYTACTDGRIPVRLGSGDTVPIRQQLVGADLVSAFYIAETLGERFYADPTAPVGQRINEVAGYLKDNGFLPSGHLACGAGAGFEVITDNVVRFSGNPAFARRSQLFLPEGVYNSELHDRILQDNQSRLQVGSYSDLRPQMFLDAIRRVSGAYAIAELNDDGRGVHGHVEELIMRLRVGQYAINESKVAELTGGREAFGVNDDRMDTIAELFGRGHDDDYRVSRMAIEYFANAGHGTLAQDLPTWRVTEAA